MKTKKPKSKLEYLKKNIVIVPVVGAILAGTFTSVRYVLTLTDTINESKETIVQMKSALEYLFNIFANVLAGNGYSCSIRIIAVFEPKIRILLVACPIV